MSAPSSNRPTAANIQGIWLDTELMGRRREEDVPPLTPDFYATAERLIARYPEGQSQSALLPLLYLAQSEHGYVSRRAIREIADLLRLTRAEVAAVATFYSMFRRDPTGKWLVSVCTQPSCTLAGSREIFERLLEAFGVANGETTADGSVTVEEVECLCACDGAPVFAINYEFYERMEVDAAVDLVKRIAAGEAPPAGARGEAPQEFKATNRRLSGIEAPR